MQIELSTLIEKHTALAIYLLFMDLYGVFTLKRNELTIKLI